MKIMIEHGKTCGNRPPHAPQRPGSSRGGHFLPSSTNTTIAHDNNCARLRHVRVCRQVVCMRRLPGWRCSPCGSAGCGEEGNSGLELGRANGRAVLSSFVKRLQRTPGEAGGKPLVWTRPFWCPTFEPSTFGRL